MFPLVVIIAAMLWAMPAAAQQVWHDYTNVRYAYSICYPADLLAPQGEADNGDGQKFVAKDGAQLAVYASYNAADKTLPDEMNSALMALDEVSYKRLASDWFAASGIKDDSILYTKTFLKDGQFTTFTLTYPKVQASTYDAVTRRIVKCFETR